MKNPFLIAFIWLLCFLLELGLSWGRPGSFFVPWGSLFVLGYAFFRLTALESFGLASASFIFQSAFSSSPPYLSAGVFLLYGAVWGLRRKTFSDNLFAKAWAVFSIVAAFRLVFPLLSGRGPFSDAGVFSLGWAGMLPYLSLNFVWAVLLFWLLQEKGEIAEERWFTLKAKRGQLNLFEARELKRAKVRQAAKSQKRVRKRFGLQDSW